MGIQIEGGCQPLSFQYLNSILYSREMLEDTLLQIIVGIIQWVVEFENGGIMNVVLKPVTIAGTPEFDQVPNLQDNAFEYVKKMLFYKPLDLGVLQAIPEALGGGQRGVDLAHANPNQEPTIFWITVSMFLLVLTLIIFLQIINCCCCCCGEESENVRLRYLTKK